MQPSAAAPALRSQTCAPSTGAGTGASPEGQPKGPLGGRPQMQSSSVDRPADSPRPLRDPCAPSPERCSERVSFDALVSDGVNALKERISNATVARPNRKCAHPLLREQEPGLSNGAVERGSVDEHMLSKAYLLKLGRKSCGFAKVSQGRSGEQPPSWLSLLERKVEDNAWQLRGRMADAPFAHTAASQRHKTVAVDLQKYLGCFGRRQARLCPLDIDDGLCSKSLGAPAPCAALHHREGLHNLRFQVGNIQCAD